VKTKAYMKIHASAFARTHHKTLEVGALFGVGVLFEVGAT